MNDRSAQSNGEPGSRPPTGAWLPALFFAACVALSLWMLTRGWHASLLDRHEFRQLQTALTTYWMQQEGWRLDYLTPLFGPPWSVPMEFPVYQYLVVAAARATSLPLEQAGRLVSVLFFLGTIPAVHGLAAVAGLSPSRRLFVAGAVLAGPTYLFYARTFMIETAALCFGSWFLLALTQSIRRPHPGWTALATACAALAALTKVTTFVIFSPPALFIALWQLRPAWQGRNTAPRPLWRGAFCAVLPVATAIAAGLWWVGYADRVKASNPFSGFLTSAALRDWNWGRPGQRFSAEFWSQLWDNFSLMVMSKAALVLLLVLVVVVGRSARRSAVWCAGFFLGGPLLFTNLFFIHDYYFAANAVFLLAAAGFLLAGACDSPRLPAVVRILVVAGYFGAQWLLFHRNFADYHRRVLPEPPAIAAVIRDTVPAGSVVLVYGWDWNSLVPYYAQRRAIMVPNGRDGDTRALEEILARLPPRRVSALLVRSGSGPANRAFLLGCTARFGLAPEPFATSGDGDLFLPTDRLAAAGRELAGRVNAGVTLPATGPGPQPPDPLPEITLAGLDLSMVRPAPLHARGQFALSAAHVDGRLVLLAHPFAEIEVPAPAGASTITAGFGLVPEAYASNAAAVTDGITVEIIEAGPDGRRHLLYRRDLDPARQPADRGRQQVRIARDPALSTTVIFRTTPGPAGNPVNDWAYWSDLGLR